MEALSLQRVGRRLRLWFQLLTWRQILGKAATVVGGYLDARVVMFRTDTGDRLR
jgi:hypothetical protein